MVPPVAAALVACGATFVALWLWHRAGLAPAPPPAGGDGGTAADALRTTLLDSGLLPRIGQIRLWLLFSIAPLVLILAGASRSLAAALFAAPLLSLLVYRNAFPYFFPFITAPAMVAAAVGAGRLRGRAALCGGALALMAASVGAQWVRALPDDQAAQRQLVAAVHRIFPAPVAYIDRNAMMASFPRYGFFMSSWGMAKYRRAGRPVFADLIARHAPPLLIADSPALQRAVLGQSGDGPYDLLPADAGVLHDSYVQYWGAIFVAGLRLDARPQAQPVTVRIAGRYRIDAALPLRIDDTPHAPGSIVDLAAGSHRVASDTAQRARLVWAAARPAPPAAPIDRPIYTGF